jgi:transposase
MANRRFEMFEIRQVIVRLRLGETDRAVARDQRVSRKKVAAIREVAAARGWLDSHTPMPGDDELAERFARYRPSPQTVSSVERYGEQVLTWAGQGIQTTTIYQALRRQYGYEGSLSSVYRFVHANAPAPKATVILEFAPGEVAQVDFGAGPPLADRHTGAMTASWIFVMTLAYSRHAYAEFVRNQKVETWLACHRRAFEWFGGVSARVSVDNAKCAIVKASFHEPCAQRAYAEFAEGWGFLISACPPRRPQLKGRVERGVGYIKGSFVPLRQFRDLEDANEQLHAWLLGEAGNRCHGTTREAPLKRFREVEQALLKPLPDNPPDVLAWARVKLYGNCHVHFENCFYSAPFRLISKILDLKLGASTVQLFYNRQLVAIHPRLVRPGDRSTQNEHMPPQAVAWLMRDPQWCLKQAEEVGPRCHALVTRLLSDSVMHYLNAAQGVLRLQRRYGPKRLEEACARALAFDSASYRTVKQILETGADLHPLPPAAPKPLPSPYTGSARFSRNLRDLLH